MIIECISGPLSGKVCKIDGGVMIGRNAKSCSVIYPDTAKGISRNHCKIEKRGNQTVITDVGSSYGTFVNGEKITPYTERVLYDGDTFYLGDRANTYIVKGEPGEQGVRRPNSGESKQGLSAGAIVAIILGSLILLYIIYYFLAVYYYLPLPPFLRWSRWRWWYY